MSALGWLSVVAAACAVALMIRPDPRLGHERGSDDSVASQVAPAPETADPGWLRRGRPWWCLLSAAAVVAFLGGTAGWVGGVVALVGVWVVIGRAESPAVRRERCEVTADLPHLVGLLGAALAAGQAPGPALALACEALPGAAATRLAVHPPGIALGLDPARVWAGLATDPELAPLGRALARAHATGAPVGAAVARLGEELAAAARAQVEDRARQVGVRAAVPLGLCLLPSFVLLGIVPLVAGLVAGLGLT